MHRFTPEQMADLGLAALANARRLFDDATLLHEHGRFTSSFVLLGLAADELGKHVMVVAFFNRPDSEAEWRKLGKRVNRHQDKLANSLWGAWAADLLSDADEPDAEEFHQKRLAATYVDLDKEGTLRTPEMVIDQRTNQEALDFIARELKFCETTMSGVSIQSMAEAMARMQAASANGKPLAPTRHREIMALAIAARAGIPRDSAMELVHLVDELLGDSNVSE